MSGRACILGCSGPVLTAQERAFFAEVRPWGFILFGRNIETLETLGVAGWARLDVGPGSAR